MTRSKKSELQRQASEKVQARAAATIPIHRESIVNLRSSLVPSTSGMMADVTNMPTRPEADPSGNSCQQYPPQISGWETKFCVEPHGDCSTCLLGTFVPCALYGKVNWRFKRRANGEGASKDDWEKKNGCNGPCWAYWACGLATGGPWGYGILPGVAAGWQRSQIRGTYGIKGNCAVDIVMGIFLGPCVLMQNDREFRCREGERALENNRRRASNNREQNHDAAGELPPCRYVAGQEIFRLQPRPHLAMVAPVHSIPRPENDQPHRMIHQQPEQVKAAESAKNTTQTDKKPAKTPGSRKMQPENVQTNQESAGETQYNQSKKSELVVLKKRIQSQRAVPIVVITGPEDSDKTTKNMSSIQLPEEHALIEFSASEADDEDSNRQHHPPASAKNSLQSDEIGNDRVDLHTLNECRPTIEPISTTRGVKQHVLAEYDQPSSPRTNQPVKDFRRSEKIGNDRVDPHTLNGCQPAIEATSAPRAVQQHPRAECEESPSIAPKVKETSYAHDFSQCPGTLLQYYKKGGKKAEPQSPAAHSTESSNNNGKKTEQQKSASDSVENSKNNKKSSNGVQEHLLEDCSKPICENCEFIGSRVSKDDPNDSDRLTTHNLEGCAGEISSVSRDSVWQHSLAECTSDATWKFAVRSENQSLRASGVMDNGEEVVQHRLSSCPTPLGMTGNRAVDHDTYGLNVDGGGDQPLCRLYWTL